MPTGTSFGLKQGSPKSGGCVNGVQIVFIAATTVDEGVLSPTSLGAEY